MAPLAAAPLAAERFQEIVSELREPAWLRRRRMDAWKLFGQQPWPTPADEAWRRTPVADFPWETIPLLPPPAVAPAQQGGLPSELERFSEDGWQEGGRLIYQDTAVLSASLAEPLRRAGVILMNLAEAAERHAGLLEPVFGRGPTLASDPLAKLALLNAACWTHGTFVYVPRGVRADPPLRIVHRSTAGNGLLAPRTVVLLEPGSELTLVEETFADPALHAPFIPSVVELIVREGAALRYYHLQNWGRETLHFYTQHATVERDGQLVSLVASLGGRLAKASVETRLTGPGARSELYGVAFGDDRQQFEYHTLQDHIAGHTTSDLLYKTALRDQATSLYTGLIRIAKEAGKSDAYQANRNLLLSPEAKADSIPMLEILTDDVRCTHGATVGPVDTEQAFYLESRGVPAPIAERMLVEGFFEQVFQKLPSAGLRDRLHAHIERKLGGR